MVKLKDDDRPVVFKEMWYQGCSDYPKRVQYGIYNNNHGYYPDKIEELASYAEIILGERKFLQFRNLGEEIVTIERKPNGDLETCISQGLSKEELEIFVKELMHKAIHKAV